MPTASSLDFTMTRVIPAQNPEDAMESMDVYQVAVSQTLAAGTVVGKVTSSGKIAAYASGNSNGTQVPIGILEYGVTSDSSGNYTSSEWGTTGTGVRVYTQGKFFVADLTGLDANAVTVLGGHLDGNGVANATYFTF